MKLISSMCLATLWTTPISTLAQGDTAIVDLAAPKDMCIDGTTAERAACEDESCKDAENWFDADCSACMTCIGVHPFDVPSNSPNTEAIMQLGETELFSFKCKSGWEGLNCDADTDDCKHHSCNRGTVRPSSPLSLPPPLLLADERSRSPTTTPPTSHTLPQCTDVAAGGATTHICTCPSSFTGPACQHYRPKCKWYRTPGDCEVLSGEKYCSNVPGNHDWFECESGCIKSAAAGGSCWAGAGQCDGTTTQCKLTPSCFDFASTVPVCTERSDSMYGSSAAQCLTPLPAGTECEQNTGTCSGGASPTCIPKPKCSAMVLPVCKKRTAMVYGDTAAACHATLPAGTDCNGGTGSCAGTDCVDKVSLFLCTRSIIYISYPPPPSCTAEMLRLRTADVSDIVRCGVRGHPRRVFETDGRRR